MSFHKLVTAIREALPPDATMTIRQHEEPPSAVFHVPGPTEFMVLVVPTKAAVLLDATEDDAA